MSVKNVKLAPPPPKRNAQRLKSAPPARIEAPNNLIEPTDDVLQDMNFKVKPEFHFTFKAEALHRRMSMKELLEASFKCYLDTHGSKIAKK